MRNRPPPTPPPTRSVMPALGVLGGLLIAPGLAAIQRVPQTGRAFAFAAAATVSVVTFILYTIDKRRAQAGAWRIPESTLHVAALLGGWPGAFLAQQTLRHKTAKASFQLAFWLIVLLHQFLAVDCLLGWRLTHDAWHALHS